jgi:DNA-binding XRE family transcriptional regulator
MMGGLQTVKTDGADELVILPRAEYDRLVAALEDAEDRASAKDFEAREAAGAVDWLPWDLAKRLRRGEHPLIIFREHRGLSQRALAKAVGMTPAQLSEIETGKKTGSVATLRRLADALGVTVDDLLGQ